MSITLYLKSIFKICSQVQLWIAGSLDFFSIRSYYCLFISWIVVFICQCFYCNLNKIIRKPLFGFNELNYEYWYVMSLHVQPHYVLDIMVILKHNGRCDVVLNFSYVKCYNECTFTFLLDLMFQHDLICRKF